MALVRAELPPKNARHFVKRHSSGSPQICLVPAFLAATKGPVIRKGRSNKGVAEWQRAARSGRWLGSPNADFCIFAQAKSIAKLQYQTYTQGAWICLPFTDFYLPPNLGKSSGSSIGAGCSGFARQVRQKIFFTLNEVRVLMIPPLIIAEAKEMSASPRWIDPDTPGSARILELGSRLASPEKYRAFRETPEGDYLLSVIEAYENAMNDDWMPYEIIGLPLEKAREFICQVATELEATPASEVIGNLRLCYARLSKP